MYPMSTDTKAVIGTTVGTGLVVAGLLTAQLSGVNTRINDIREELREQRADIREDHERFDTRLDAVEVALG